MTSEKRRIQKRAWRLANRDKVLAQKERYRQRHPEKIKVAQKRHYEANKPRRLEKARAWALANPDKVKAAGRKCSAKQYAENPRKMIAAVVASRQKRLASESPQERQVRTQREKAAQKRWVALHPGYSAASSARYRSKYPEKKVEQWKKYYDTHKEQNAEKQRQYRIKNRHITADQKHRRRARLKFAFVENCKDKILDLKKETLCHWCHIPMEGKVTIDHVIPLSRGGKHESDNLVAACRSCNSRKHDKLPNEFIKEAA